MSEATTGPPCSGGVGKPNELETVVGANPELKAGMEPGGVNSPGFAFAASMAG